MIFAPPELEEEVGKASRLTLFRNPSVPAYLGLWTYRERFRRGKAGRRLLKTIDAGFGFVLNSKA